MGRRGEWSQPEKESVDVGSEVGEAQEEPVIGRLSNSTHSVGKFKHL